MRPFEIITVDGNRFRYDSLGYRWQYGLVPGTLDVEDKTVVEVLHLVGDEEELETTYTQVIAVGNVTEHTLLVMPPEKRHTICPRCGYLEVKG